MAAQAGGELPYATATAMRKALRDRLASHARASGGHGLAELQRHVAYDRLLARVFTSDEAERWVLKGAGALLARLPEARHSRDIDLAFAGSSGQAGTSAPPRGSSSTDAAMTEAVEALRLVADRDLGDFFRFEILRTNALREGALGRRVDVVSYLGTRYAEFHVDVVVGTVMTAAPETSHPLTPIRIDGLRQPSYRLFPLVDHIADKLCAILEVHHHEGGARPSTRVKDLVDLALITSTQSVDASSLRRALTLGAAHRALVLPDRFRVPDLDLWRTGYPAKAREAATEVPDFDDTVDLVARFLDPVLADSRPKTQLTWNPRERRWA